jgi:Tol biopolymer transport system component
MNRGVSALLFAPCFFLCLPFALAQNQPATSPFAGNPAWIAYQTNRGGEGIWLIHPDGTGDHRIAAGVFGGQLLPDWSPDGTRIAFTTRGGATEPIYEYDLRTGVSRELFACEDPCVGDDEPAYSRDGTKVALIRYLGPFVSDIPSDCALAIGDVATGQVVQVTSNTEPQCDREYFPRWSPDGSQLTYWRYPPRGTAVFVVNADGTDERRLTDPAISAGDPDWSPDGIWIVFSTNPLHESGCCKVSNLFRMHPDGSGMEQLTHYETVGVRATQPRYTPDGQYIVFTAVRPSSRSLWAIPAEGGEPILLAHGGIFTHGTWQPQTPRD